jgi:hypothetical protein
LFSIIFFSAPPGGFFDCWPKEIRQSFHENPT